MFHPCRYCFALFEQQLVNVSSPDPFWIAQGNSKQCYVVTMAVCTVPVPASETAVDACPVNVAIAI